MVTKTRTIPDEAVDDGMPQGLMHSPRGKLACDVFAVSALALLTQSHGKLSSAGDFLAQVYDQGISRPMLDIDELDLVMASSAMRAGKSLSTMELSLEDASTIDAALANKSARPTIAASRLPETG